MKIAGGIYCPTDETGESAKFTRALAAKIVARGGASSHRRDNQRARDRRRPDRRRRRPTPAPSRATPMSSRSVPRARILARKFGLDLPIYPIKGYSLTIPIGNRLSPPTIASVDEHNLVAISRFGDRIRVTATAEFAGYDTSHKPSDFAFMKRVTRSSIPMAATTIAPRCGRACGR